MNSSLRDRIPTVSSWDQINRKNKDDSVSRVLDILPESPVLGCAFNSIRRSNTRLKSQEGMWFTAFWGKMNKK